MWEKTVTNNFNQFYSDTFIGKTRFKTKQVKNTKI